MSTNRSSDDGPVFVEEIRPQRGSWQRWVFPAFWLVYLGQTGSGVSKHSDGWVSVLGVVVLIGFAFTYLWALPMGWPFNRRRVGVGLTILILLTVIEAPIAHEDAFVMCVFIGVICMAGLGRWGWPVVGVMTVVAVVTPALVPSWHTGADWDMGITIPLVAFAMFGFFALIRNNRALSEARSEVARLAAENERSRIARDLHDLLGHSLTTITVKAALARRLAEIDPARSAQEIGEVEELTRGALSDVRAAVAGYREVTIAGELASAHEVLRAAGIDADLPRATDVVPAERRELFGWVVREGVTNVVRHSRAGRCVITLGPTWLEITDDGRGSTNGSGHGLAGLTERVSAAGATLRITTSDDPDDGHGFTLRLDAPPSTPRREEFTNYFEPVQPVRGS